MLQSAPIDSFG
ncbi:23S rRNA (uracil-5-)-methyltransferase RumB, partial [Yersinia pestis PY-06]